MAVLLNNHGEDNGPWKEALAQGLPSLEIVEYPEVGDPETIRYAVIWHHPHGDLARYPNLKAILLLGAGTDHIDQDVGLPDVPIVRLIDPDVGIDMAHYVCYHVLHFHRQYDRYEEQKTARLWERHKVARAKDFRVTVLGLGRIGKFIAERVADLGYQVCAWSRSQHQVDRVTCYSGASGLQDVLAKTDLLVNCLPLNKDTDKLIDYAMLTLMPKGGYLINISRGAVIEDAALIAALENGQLSAAALDTFAVEPLPQDSPYWTMHNVIVTPHMSGATYARSAVQPIVENILRIEDGEQPFPIHSNSHN